MESLENTTGADRPMSMLDKLTNIFASPGEVFENVRLTGPTNSNWLVPWLVYLVISLLTNQFIIGNPSLADQLGATIKEQFDKSVKPAITEGKLTQEEADKQYEQFARPGSAGFMMLSIGGMMFGSIAVLFALALFYWLVGKSAMNAAAPYMKVAEVVGLTFFIGSLERLVTTLLMFATDSIQSSPSLALFLSNVDLTNKAHVALSKVNAFTFWDLTVTSIGLSKLFQRDFAKVFVLILALWLLWSLFTLFTGVNLTG